MNDKKVVSLKDFKKKKDAEGEDLIEELLGDAIEKNKAHKKKMAEERKRQNEWTLKNYNVKKGK